MMIDPLFLVFLLIGIIVLFFVTVKVLQHRDDGAVSKRSDRKSHRSVDLSHPADSPQWHHEDSHKPEQTQGH
jgi:uncharacterized protein YpmS